MVEGGGVRVIVETGVVMPSLMTVVLSDKSEVVAVVMVSVVTVRELRDKTKHKHPLNFGNMNINQPTTNER